MQEQSVRKLKPGDGVRYCGLVYRYLRAVETAEGSALYLTPHGRDGPVIGVAAKYCDRLERTPLPRDIVPGEERVDG